MSIALSMRTARFLLIGVALLAASLLAVLPQVASAQPPPPAVFFGSVSAITVDGQPWDGTTIEIIDEDGNVIDTVNINGGSWTAEIANSVDSIRFRVGDAVSASFEIVPGSVSNIVLAIGVGGPGLRLEVGFNFLVWRGETVSVDDGLASFPNMSQLSAIFEFDAGTQTWSSFRPGLPPAVQGISELQAGGAYFFLVTGTMSWELPSGGDGSGTQTIVSGFTAIGWVGPGGSPEDVLDAVANAGAVAVFFRFNAATQSYESFRPGLPAAVQGIKTVRTFDVLFFSATSQTSITQ